jgi:hypothetical protein
VDRERRKVPVYLAGKERGATTKLLVRDAEPIALGCVGIIAVRPWGE